MKKITGVLTRVLMLVAAFLLVAAPIAVFAQENVTPELEYQQLQQLVAQLEAQLAAAQQNQGMVLGTSFGVGSMVKTTTRLNVRSSASLRSRIVCRESSGATGTIIGSPQTANGDVWWNVKFSNCSGWSDSSYLSVVTTTIPTTPPLPPTTPTSGVPVPGVGLSTTSLTFPSEQVGVASPAQTITLTNNGAASLTISSIPAISGDFTYSSSGTCVSSLSASASCTYMLSFKPSATGTRTGSFTITDNASTSPQKITLTGTGSAATTAPAPTPPTPTPTPPTPTPTSGSITTPASFFSMDWNDYLYSLKDWPTVPFGGIRLWDSNVAWQLINTANGTYSWVGLDDWLSASQSHGQDLLYTFGRTPQWASMRPTESCGYGNDGCAAPPSDVSSGDTIWKTFVTALVEHSLASTTGHIKYYELWNEPDCGCTWTGTDTQLVTMAKDAYSIIHSLDPNAVVLGPSPEGWDDVSWLQGYYAAGGAQYQDAVAIHTYVGSDPSAQVSALSGLRTLMTSNNIGNEPIFATEGSWGTSGLTDAQKAQWLAQEYMYLWAGNVSRFYWYSWDPGDQWGGLTNSGGTINEAGITYANLQQWLVGSTHTSSACTEASNSTWTCNLTLTNGKQAEILWNEKSNVTASVSSTFTTYQTINTTAVGANSSTTITGGSVPVRAMPILVVGN